MRIEILGTAFTVPEQLPAASVAVIIDVYRATTTITTALSNGCQQVKAVATVEEAFAFAKTLPTGNYLLGGEREAVVIPGFHLGNSPIEYTPATVKGKTLIITTTNGTNAVHNSTAAQHMYLAALINGQAVAQQLTQYQDKDVFLVCAGTKANFSLEDFVCAGKLIYQLRQLGMAPDLSDFAQVAVTLYTQNRQNLKDLLSLSSHYQVLSKLNMQADVEFCSQEDTHELVPKLNDGFFVPA